MKTPEEYLNDYNLVTSDVIKFETFHRVVDLIKLIQKEVYNEAIDGVLEISSCNDIPRNHIVDLKK